MSPEKSRIQDAMALISSVRRTIELCLGKPDQFEKFFYDYPLRPKLGVEGKDFSYGTHLAKALREGLRGGIERHSKVWKSSIEIVTWHFRSRHRDGLANEDGDWISEQVFFGSRTAQEGLRTMLKGRKEPSKPTSSNSPMVPFLARSPYIELFREELLHERKPTIHYPADRQFAESGATTLVVPPDIVESYLVCAELPDQFNRFPEQASAGRWLPGELTARLRETEEGERFLTRLRSWRRQFKDGPHSPAGEMSDEGLIREFLPLTKVTLFILRAERQPSQVINRPPSRSTCLAPVFVSGDDVGGFAFVFRGLVTEEEASIASELAYTSLSLLRLREDVIARRDLAQSVRLDYVKTFAVRRLSHGIRHPVGVVKVSAERLADMAQRMVVEVGEIQRRIDESLQAILSRDVSGVLRPQLQEDSLWEYMQDIEFAARPQLAAKEGKSLVPKLGAGVTAVTRIRIDKQMIREALENIIGNAIEHGGNAMVLSAERVGLNTLVLTVSDDGPGVVDPVYRSLLKAERIDEFPPLRSGSRGMGLLLSRLLISNHGEGATLTFTDRLDTESIAMGDEMTRFRIVLPNAIVN